MRKQVHVYYTGRVQGVGFRFTTKDLARDLGVCGWAKNLRNGGVEVVAEAEEDTVKDFLSRVNNFFSHYIQDAEVYWQAASLEFKDFTIEI